MCPLHGHWERRGSGAEPAGEEEGMTARESPVQWSTKRRLMFPCTIHALEGGICAVRLWVRSTGSTDTDGLGVHHSGSSPCATFPTTIPTEQEGTRQSVRAVLGGSASSPPRFTTLAGLYCTQDAYAREFSRRPLNLPSHKECGFVTLNRGRSFTEHCSYLQDL